MYRYCHLLWKRFFCMAPMVIWTTYAGNQVPWLCHDRTDTTHQGWGYTQHIHADSDWQQWVSSVQPAPIVFMRKQLEKQHLWKRSLWNVMLRCRFSQADTGNVSKHAGQQAASDIVLCGTLLSPHQLLSALFCRVCGIKDCHLCLICKVNSSFCESH